MSLIERWLTQVSVQIRCVTVWVLTWFQMKGIIQQMWIYSQRNWAQVYRRQRTPLPRQLRWTSDQHYYHLHEGIGLTFYPKDWGDCLLGFLQIQHSARLGILSEGMLVCRFTLMEMVPFLHTHLSPRLIVENLYRNYVHRLEYQECCIGIMLRRWMVMILILCILAKPTKSYIHLQNLLHHGRTDVRTRSALSWRKQRQEGFVDKFQTRFGLPDCMGMSELHSDMSQWKRYRPWKAYWRYHWYIWMDWLWILWFGLVLGRSWWRGKTKYWKMAGSFPSCW